MSTWLMNCTLDDSIAKQKKKKKRGSYAKELPINLNYYEFG